MADLTNRRTVAFALLQAEQRAKMDELIQTFPSSLGWKEWLLQEANQGDEAAIAALRGIAMQASRDARRLGDTETPAIPHPRAGETPAPTSQATDTLPPTPQPPTQQTAAPLTSTPDTHPSPEAQRAEDAAQAESERARQEREQRRQDAEDYVRIVSALIEQQQREKAIRGAKKRDEEEERWQLKIRQARQTIFTVTGNGNIRYADATTRRVLFTDRGDRITFDRVKVTDDDLQRALEHAAAKFGGRLVLTGDDPVFLERMIRMAHEMNLTVINPEAQPIIQRIVAEELAAEQAAAAALAQAAEAATTQTPTHEVPKAPSTPAPQPSQPQTDKRMEPQIPVAQPTPPVPTPTVPDTLPVTPEPVMEHTPASPEPTTKPATPERRELALAELRREILSQFPTATFVPAQEDRGKYYGKVVAVGDDCFAQMIGQGKVVIHTQAPPKNIPADQLLGSNRPVNIRYQGGAAAYIPPARRTSSGRKG